MVSIDQTERTEITVPIPFSVEQLSMLVKFGNGWTEPETSEMAVEFIEYILKRKQLELNPSHELGDGATVVQMFSLGFMVYMKHYHNMDVDPKILWWHPLSKKVPTKIEVNIEFDDLVLDSDHKPMRTAIDGRTGKIVHASDIEKNLVPRERAKE